MHLWIDRFSSVLRGYRTGLRLLLFLQIVEVPWSIRRKWHASWNNYILYSPIWKCTLRHHWGKGHTQAPPTKHVKIADFQVKTTSGSCCISFVKGLTMKQPEEVICKNGWGNFPSHLRIMHCPAFAWLAELMQFWFRRGAKAASKAIPKKQLDLPKNDTCIIRSWGGLVSLHPIFFSLHG